ncbi:Cytochrome c heme lyase subunit CcmL [hydrothermal vent metagenome]|uniref:Cytochrome c heme lyase subunit CcmL n=1 Tax=hydrothermal vent metagenome TaxID=652676 RepID=A0A3B1B525_9ZZZZ
MRMLKPLILFFSLLLFAGLASASALSTYTFDSNEEEQAFRDLSAELRCLVCQNQSLADSDAGLADDLRREVYNLWRDGKSEDEIKAFLVARYGNFVLYDPPFNPSTYILWFGPFILFIVGGIVLSRALKSKAEDQEVELSDEDKQRLKTLLSNDNQDAPK